MKNTNQKTSFDCIFNNARIIDKKALNNIKGGNAPDPPPTTDDR